MLHIIDVPMKSKIQGYIETSVLPIEYNIVSACIGLHADTMLCAVCILISDPFPVLLLSTSCSAIWFTLECMPISV